MTDPSPNVDHTDWVCGRCGTPLAPSQVTVAYLGNGFPVALPQCPTCGLVFIPEELTLGRMADVEKELEDK